MNLLAKEKNDSARAGYMMWIAQRKMGLAQNTGKWEESIEWWQRALKLYKKINNEFCIGRCNIFLGMCWQNKGDHTEAAKYFYDALQLSQRNGNKALTVASSANLANCYTNLGNYEEALKNHFIAYKAQEFLNTDVPLDVRQIAAGIAGVYTKLHRYEEALNWYQKAHPYDPTNFYEGHLEIQMASIQLEMKNYEEALKNYRAVVQVFPKRFQRKDEMGYKGIEGGWYMELGETYFKIGTLTKNDERLSSFKNAIHYLNKSLPLLTEGAGGKETLMKAYDLLKQACEATNDYESALRYSNLYTTMKDSIYNKENYVKIADLKIKYETEKTTAEMKINQEKERMRQETLRDKMLADQKLEDQKKLDAQKLEQEKAIAIAQEKANSEKLVAVEKIKSEKRQTNNLLLMGLVLVAVTAVFLILYLRQRHEKKRAVEKAETVHQMAELELQSLRSQLNPHFMFNSLNSIQTLIMKEQTDKSQSYLSRFARLLRMLLENADKQFIPLQSEMEFLQLYLSLESLRVPDMQFSISTDPSLNAEQILIPNMMLQPYVENAIWHGLSHKEQDKQLKIRISKENGTINYEIEDNGVGRKKAGELKSLFRKQHQSKGMELLNKRIELLNKEYRSVIQTDVTDVVKNKEIAGTLVSIKIPLTLSEHTQN